MHLDIGSEVVVEAVPGTSVHRHGEVIEEGEGRHYRVRWSDGHVSLFFPEPDSYTVQPY